MIFNLFIDNLPWIIAAAFHLFLIAIIIFIIMENRDAQSTFAWIMVFMLLPFIGFLIYMFFGRNWRLQSTRKKKFYAKLTEELDKMLGFIESENPNLVKDLKEGLMSDHTKIVDMLYNTNESMFTRHNTVKILQNGAVKFPALKKDLRKAKEFIHMEYFIWRDDKLTNEIKDILIDRVNNGVKVRIMFDPAGSILLLFKGKKYIKEMRDAGIKFIPFFNSMARSKLTTLNNINHRKVVVIDGHIGYTGGMNMGQEYIDGKPMYKSWRDTFIRVEGESALALHAIFAYDWMSITGKSLFKEKYFKKLNKEEYPFCPIYSLASGPTSQDSTIRQLYCSMIATAKKNVYVQSPYFVPDPTIYEALKLSARAGVDVRVMVTGVPDKKVAYWAAFAFFEDLIKSGVKIYHYNAGFIHSKTISVDKTFCTIGTTNLDLRSFMTSHETNSVIFDEKTTTELTNDFINDIKECTEMTLEDYKKMSSPVKFRNSMCKLLAPLL
jgi:cardiolipin synthase